jgi:hypothetical protein
MDNTLKSSLHVVGHKTSRRKNGRKHVFKNSTELYHKEKRVRDEKAAILRKGTALSIIIIIIIIVIFNTANRPDTRIVSETKKEETCMLIYVAILRTEILCKRKQKRNLNTRDYV